MSSKPPNNIAIKRIYEKTCKDDGVRILVDRIWPRGISKSDAHLDHWLKHSAPSKELRLWFAHDPNKWKEFEERYHAEMKGTESVKDEMQIILDHAAKRKVTLLFAARDVEHNNAVALLHYLEMQ